MKLTFTAKPGHLVRHPAAPITHGQPVRYIGKEPVEFDSASQEGLRLVRLVKRDNSLLPGDKDTAKFCGLLFVEPVSKSKKG